MDLIFEKKEQYWGKDAAWVSEFEVTADFNLHIERISGGRFLVYQKSVADGEYDLVDGVRKDHKATIDMDFVALVYPKWIKVVSEAEVTRAAVLPEGVAEPNIKLIEFYVVGTPYQADEGMTWQQFVDSDYNDGQVEVYYNYVQCNGNALANPSGMSYMTAPSDPIVPNHNYDYAEV